MRISVTGASGFLGKKLVKLLDSQGHHVIAWMRDPTMSGYNKDCRNFDLEQVDKINLSDSQAIIHCAAYLPDNFEDPSEATKCLVNNGIATLKLLQKAGQDAVKIFIYISSGSIYNWKSQIASETDAIYPSTRASYYLASKMVGDVFTDNFSRKSKMRIVILRPSYIYGPGMKPKGLLPNMINKLQKDLPLDLYKIGNYNVDLVHVDDVAWMASQAITDEQIHGTFNIGGGSPVNTVKLANMLANLLVKPKQNSLIRVDGHAMLDISKAKSFGYSPRDLEDGLRSYMESIK